MPAPTPRLQDSATLRLTPPSFNEGSPARHANEARQDNEDGFTMIMTVIGMSLVAALVLVAVTAVTGDTHLTVRDLQQKQAYEAAKAGIDDYAYHLHANNTLLDQRAPASNPNAVNQVGSTTKKRRRFLATPGPNTRSNCSRPPASPNIRNASHDHATEACSSPSDPLKGTFRIRSTGFSGQPHVSIVATFKPASFLDYVYFTQRETSDPVTYGFTNTRSKQARKTVRQDDQGRPLPELKSTSNKYCDMISFVTGDIIKGPMHTNDAFAICNSPTLGGSAADPVEVS